MFRRGLAPAALVLIVVVVSWLVSGVTAGDVVRFVAYDVVFVAIPGMTLLWAVRGRRSGFLVTVALGWPIGQALEILAFVATAAIGARGLFLVYPIVVIVPSVVAIWRNPKIRGLPSSSLGLSTLAMWMSAVAVSIGVVYLTLMLLPWATLPASDVRYEYLDFPYFIGLITQVANHWPPTSAGLSGVPLAYEWFVFFHIAAASQVTHVSIPVIALRLDYLPTILVVGCQLLALGRLFGRAAQTGAIAVGILFLLGTLDLTVNQTGSPFGDNVLIHLWDSWTFPFGLMFFLALLYLIQERLRADTWRTGSDLGSWALIVLLMVEGSGAKATVLPVILVGTGLYFVLGIVLRRGISVAALVTVMLTAVIFALTYLVIYAGETPDTHIGFFAWLVGSVTVLYAETIHHNLVREVLLPLAYIAGFAGVMLPLAGMLYVFRRRYWPELSAFALPLCMFIAGVLICGFVHQSSDGELYFQDMGYVAGCLVAAEGIRLAWLDAGRSLPFSRLAAIVALAVWVGFLVLVVKVTEGSVGTPEKAVYRYAALVALAVVFIAAWAFVLRVRGISSKGVLALGLIPLTAAALLTSPIIVSPTARKVLDGETLNSPQVILPAPLLTALVWLRNHSTIDEVFAVNNHWIDPGKTDGKFYYYSPFAQRQIFIEAYNPIRYGVSPGIASKTASIFAYRQQLNDAVFDHADAAALAVMTQQYSVRFLFFDLTRGSADAAVLQLGHVVFTNPDATIVAVG
jgi:hypothetical protein